MEALLFMIVGAIIGTVASNPMASMDQAMEQAVFTHELYLNATCRKFRFSLSNHNHCAQNLMCICSTYSHTL